MTMQFSPNGEFSLHHEVMSVSLHEDPGLSIYGKIAIKGEDAPLSYVINYTDQQRCIVGIAKALEHILHQHLLDFEAREMERFLS